MIKRTFIVSSLVLSLAGCSNGPSNFDTSELTNHQIQTTEKIFVGIPFYLGIDGSSTRLDENWVATAAHNKPILMATFKDAIYHPTCDIALYRSKLPGFKQKFNTVYIDETVYHTGYPMALPLSSNKGQVIGNLRMKKYPDCRMIGTTGTVAKSMSGGAVFNESGDLVGINHGWATSKVSWPTYGRSLENGGVFLPLIYVKDWIKEVTGNDYFEDVKSVQNSK